MYALGKLFATTLRLSACLMLLFSTFAPVAATELTIRVGISDNPPTAFLDDKGRPSGFTPEFLDEVARQEGWTLEYSYDTFANLHERLKRGEIDLAAMAYTPERDLAFDFNSEGLASRWGMVYVRIGTGVDSLADLSGKRVAVTAKDVHADLFRQAVDLMDVPVQLIEVKSYEEVFRKLQRQEADAGVVDSVFGATRSEFYPVIPTRLTFKPIQLMFAFAEGRRPQWSKILDRHLRNGKADPDSPYQKIHRRWLGPPTKPNTEIQLTIAERAWLAEHPTVRIAFDGHFPPYSYLDRDGRPTGFAVEVAQELARRLGVKLEISPLTLWSDLYAAAERLEVDLVATMVDRPERRNRFQFTAPYIFKSLVIITRSDEQQLAHREDLAGRRVALVQDYQYDHRILEEFPSVTPVWADTMLDALNAVAIGQADACISFHAAAESIRNQYQLGGLKYAAIYDRDSARESFAVRSDWPTLATLLDKALDSMAGAEMLALQQRWLPTALPLTGQEVPLSVEEQAWVEAHPVIRIGVHSDLMPFDFVDPKGNYQGIAADYLELLGPRLGLKFERTATASWQEAVDGAASGTIDLLSSIARTTEREKTLAFSDPFIDYNRVVITRSDAPFIGNLDDISHWRIAVPAQSAHAQYLKERGVEAISYSSFQDGLAAVSGGNADAFIGNVATCAYWIRQLNLSNLKVAASLSVDTLHFAARKDWPVLARLIDKGLATVSDEEARQIRQRWIAIDYSPGVPLRKIAMYVGFGLVAVLAAGGALLAWNRRLQQEVRQRIAAEHQLEEKHRFEQLAARTAQRFVGISADEVDDQIVRSLEELARWAGAPSACFSMETGDGHCCMDCTHVWHRPEALTGAAALNQHNAQTVSELTVPPGEEGTAQSLQERIKSALLGNDPNRPTFRLNLPTRCQYLLGSEQQPAPNGLLLDDLRCDLFRQIFTGALRQKLLQQALSERAEEALQNNRTMLKLLDELKASNRELDAFSYSVSHDLRSPLRSINGFSRILAEEHVAELSEEALGLLARIRNAAQRMGQLIDDLLAFSRLGRSLLSRRTVDMTTLVKQVIEEQRVEQDGRDLEIQLSDLAEAQGDAKLLRQIWVNLIGNALKYSRTRERAVIEIGNQIAPDGRVVYFIRDNGVGFDMRHAGKLFGVFQRLHGIEAFEGTGVGLAIVKRIIQRHGGEVWAEGEVNRGACFYFSLDQGIKTMDNSP